jgi:hypothetical protein
MAKCRCNICKSRREPAKAEVSPSRFHTEAKTYEISGGHIMPTGLMELARLIRDFKTGMSDHGKLDYDRLVSYMMNRPRFSRYLLGQADLPVGELFLSYLAEIPGNKRNSHNICPEYSPVAGRDEAERLKNFHQRVKQWVRWYTDRAGGFSDIKLDVGAFVEELGCQWVTKEGKFTTRLSSALFAKGIKLRKEQLETVANTLNDYVVKDGKYDFTFDQGFVNGTPEEYCHRDSCWWGGYAQSRPMLRNNGGYALRMWEKGKPVARCWVAPVADGYLIFNAYGKLDLNLFAQILSTDWGMKFTRCSLTYPSGIYINNCAGFHLHAEQPKTHIALEWAGAGSVEYVPPAHACEVCGEAADETQTICNACFDRDTQPDPVPVVVQTQSAATITVTPTVASVVTRRDGEGAYAASLRALRETPAGRPYATAYMMPIEFTVSPRVTLEGAAQ